MGQGSLTFVNNLINSQYDIVPNEPTCNEARNTKDNQLNIVNLNDNLSNNNNANDNQLNNNSNNINVSDTQFTSNYIELSICSMNVQGLKKFEGDQTFLNFCRKYDIIGMYETWQQN